AQNLTGGLRPDREQEYRHLVQAAVFPLALLGAGALALLHHVLSLSIQRCRIWTEFCGSSLTRSTTCSTTCCVRSVCSSTSLATRSGSLSSASPIGAVEATRTLSRRRSRRPFNAGGSSPGRTGPSPARRTIITIITRLATANAPTPICPPYARAKVSRPSWLLAS